jgi:hypothetical protein
MTMRSRYKPYRADGRTWCCYKDDPCETHARVLEALVGLAQGDTTFNDTMKVIGGETPMRARRDRRGATELKSQ